jgi:cytochrome oxidase Cu insertion factor (SCO1/SenC/PrrC family)
MPGMTTGLNIDDPAVVAAFRSALLHQGIIALLIFALLGAAWAAARAWPWARAAGTPSAPGVPEPRLKQRPSRDPEPARRPGRDPESAQRPSRDPEPTGRLLLVIGFGNLWLLDGILQAQPRMALGLPSQIIEPTAASSPAWVQHLVNWAGTSWSYHPMQAAAAAVWIQVGLGIWILAAPRGVASRLAGLASVGWGLVVWVFGEAFGGLLAPGLSWLTGAPGAAALYVVAGGLLALPERAWHSPRLGRLLLAGLGVFLIGMAVLQAWPGRGSWSGLVDGQPGPLAGMSMSMSVTPQPGILSGWLAAFATFDEAHGFAVNLVLVASLALAGAAFLSGRRAAIRPALAGFAGLCLATWVLAQDLGFLGGLGTDPNSMIPFILLAGAGYLALVRTAPDPGQQTEPEQERGQRAGRVPARARAARLAAAASSRSLAAVGGAALIVLGAAPLAAAQASRDADPILAQSIAGGSGAADYPAPGFVLTGSDGRPVTGASLRGAVVLLAFVDLGCGAGCPPLGPQLRMFTQMLGSDQGRVELIGIGAPPAGSLAAAWRAFDRRQGLSRVPGWQYLTGNAASLGRVWRAYGAGRGGAVFVIDPAGRVRRVFRHDPGPGSAATQSSFAVLFTAAARQALNG